MISIKQIALSLIVTTLSIGSVWAEDAPVYDVDNYPPAFDGQPDGGATATPATPTQATAAPAPATATPAQPAPMPRAAPATVAPPSTASLSTDQRLGRLEQQINNMQQGDAAAKVNALQTEVQALRNQVEELNHKLEQMATQQQAMYTDLDKRLNQRPNQAKAAVLPTEPEDIAKDTPVKPVAVAKTVAKTVTTPPVVKPSVAPTPASPAVVAKASAAVDQPNTAEEQQTYQTAYDLIKAKKYTEAISTLQKMLQKYPTGQFAANAHYWLGELYGLLNNNEQSAKEFATIVKDFPDSPKVSDAQLKLGLIYAAQFKWVDAKTAFKKVINQYPGTASARLALEQLKQIKQSGH